jgi:hypothetical protein
VNVSRMELPRDPKSFGWGTRRAGRSTRPRVGGGIAAAIMTTIPRYLQEQPFTTAPLALRYKELKIVRLYHHGVHCTYPPAEQRPPRLEAELPSSR